MRSKTTNLPFALSRLIGLMSVMAACASPCFAQQARLPIVAASTSFEDAIVQIALYYSQPIGLELANADDRVTVSGTAARLDLATVTFDEAMESVLMRTSRPYRWRRAGEAVFVRPQDSDADANSWVNERPGGPGVRPYVAPDGSRLMLSVPFMAPDLTRVTVSESWREIQRPGSSWLNTERNLQQQELSMRFREIDRQVMVAPAATVWDTMAAVMMAHRGVAAWTLSHPGARAVQGQTTLEIVGAPGWFLTFPGIAPAPIRGDMWSMARMIPRLDQFGKSSLDLLQDALPPPQPPAPLPGR